LLTPEKKNFAAQRRNSHGIALRIGHRNGIEEMPSLKAVRRIYMAMACPGGCNGSTWNESPVLGGYFERNE
jgi:hypothetical protein